MSLAIMLLLILYLVVGSTSFSLQCTVGVPTPTGPIASPNAWRRLFSTSPHFHPSTASQLRLLRRAATSEESDEAAEMIEEVLPEEKKLLLDQRRLCSAYGFGRVVLALLALIVMLIPDRTKTAKLATKWGSAAGYGVSAGLCHILSEATSNNRLGSDTYQRLNLGLVGFFAASLFAVPGEAGFCKSASSAISMVIFLTAARLYGLVVAMTGWVRGVLPVEYDGAKLSIRLKTTSLLQTFWKGTKNTIRGLRVADRKEAFTYRNILLFVVFGIFSSLMEGRFYLAVSATDKVKDQGGFIVFGYLM